MGPGDGPPGRAPRPPNPAARGAARNAFETPRNRQDWRINPALGCQNLIALSLEPLARVALLWDRPESDPDLARNGDPLTGLPGPGADAGHGDRPSNGGRSPNVPESELSVSRFTDSAAGTKGRRRPCLRILTYVKRSPRASWLPASLDPIQLPHPPRIPRSSNMVLPSCVLVIC